MCLGGGAAPLALPMVAILQSLVNVDCSSANLFKDSRSTTPILWLYTKCQKRSSRLG